MDAVRVYLLNWRKPPTLRCGICNAHCALAACRAACSAEVSTERVRGGKKGYYVEPWLTNETIEALTAGTRVGEALPFGAAPMRIATPVTRALVLLPRTAGQSSNRRPRFTDTAQSTRTRHHRTVGRTGAGITAPAAAVTAHLPSTRVIRTRAPAPAMRTSTNATSAAVPAPVAKTRADALRAGVGSSRMWRRSSRWSSSSPSS